MVFIQKRIQLVVSRIHLRPLNGLSDLRREILDSVHSALDGSKPLQIPVLARGHGIIAHHAIAGDRDGSRCASSLYLPTVLANSVAVTAHS